MINVALSSPTPYAGGSWSQYNQQLIPFTPYTAGGTVYFMPLQSAVTEQPTFPKEVVKRTFSPTRSPTLLNIPSKSRKESLKTPTSNVGASFFEPFLYSPATPRLSSTDFPILENRGRQGSKSSETGNKKNVEKMSEIKE